jgi:putative transposase
VIDGSMDDKYITIKELADLKGVSTRAIRLAKSKYQIQEIKVKGGKSFDILLSSIEPELQEKYLNKTTELNSTCTALIPLHPAQNLPNKANEIALARLDLIREWQKFRTEQRFRTKADKEFLDTYNTGLLYQNIFSKLGTISIGTLERWKRKLGNTTDYHLLLPNYNYSTEFRTTLTDFEKQVFLKILLHPNKFSVGKAISITKHILAKTEQVNISDITFRRYANWFRDNHFDIWTLARDGEKTLKDNVEPFIKRDISKLNVGDVLVADGHKLAFLVQNPFTGKPCRASLIGFLDWRSSYLCGYEIMLEENTQSIASALRNSIINLQNIPKIVYQDNGRAFKAKYFTQTDFQESGFEGLYAKLGIKTVFAKPYNARAKVIERFFLEFQESFEKLLPTYSGSNIENKPAHFKRNEKFHSQYFKPNYIPTIDEVKKLIDNWLEFKHSQICPNDNSKNIKEIFATREKIKIDISKLDYLMMSQEIKTVYRNGIRFLNTFYWSEKLYGLKTKVMIKHSLFDLASIRVYSIKNQFICTAKRVESTHPMAYHLGEAKDIEEFKQKIQKQKKLKNKTLKAIKKFLPTEDIRFIEEQINIELTASEEAECSLPPPLPLNPTSIFKTNFEKYEYLMQKGCTNQNDRTWLKKYKESEEYKSIYE